jgi:hypothetical protein
MAELHTEHFGMEKPYTDEQQRLAACQDVIRLAMRTDVAVLL